VTVYASSTSPLGPYTQQQTITTSIAAQQTDIVFYYDEDKNPQYLWRGDRWQSAPDQIKGHDFTYVGPMKFDASGIVQPLPFLDNFQISVFGSQSS
jgi:hypothetical protein